ncbi:MAG: hypothetical protein ABW022_08385 [Actinoplanes sp.]
MADSCNSRYRATYAGRPLGVIEKEVLRLLAEGYTETQIAELLHLTIGETKHARRRLLAALGGRTSAHTVAIAYREGHLGDGTDEDLAVVRQARELGYRVALVPREDT